MLFMMGALLLAMTLLALLVAFRTYYGGRISPGLSAFGVDLSGMTREEAVDALSGHFIYDESTVFTFIAGSQTWSLTAGALGVSFDPTATVDAALQIGNTHNLIDDLVDQALAWFHGKSVAPIIHYDQSIALNQLTAIAEQVNQPVQNASLLLRGTEIIASAAQVGRELDIASTLIALDNVILTLSGGGNIPLYINEIAPAVWNVDEAANMIRAALSTPLELTTNGPDGQQLGPWTASVDQIASLLQIDLIDNGDGTQHYAINIDMSAFENHLHQLAPGLITSPQDGRFHFDEESGQLIVIKSAVNGRELNIPQTLTQLEYAVFRYDARRVPMVFDYTLAHFHNDITAVELGITELVAEATTYYTGSSTNRRHNIAHGASLFDGVIIAPGEEFSFNTLLGDLSLATGFLESSVIVGERTVDGIGGGICQVSTTAFRAAFMGGFAIIERNNHAYRVGFYELNGPPGLDAAIWTPERDMRFQNDTPYHLLVETSIYPTQEAIQFRFYSTNPGRTVQIQDPIIKNIAPALSPHYEPNRDLQPGQIVQVDWAAEGADVTVPRIIQDLEGNIIKEDSTYTHYVPWRPVYQVAPGDSRLSGA